MKQQPQFQIPLIPNRESITEQQVATILAVIHNLQPYLLEQVVELGHQNPPPLDGEAKSSAVATFVQACNRMDEILSQPDRWSIKTHDELYTAIIETHKKQQEFLHEQSESVKQLRRPSYQLRPTLAVAGNDYIAFFGDISRPGCALVGRGKTPNEALLDFDAAFNRIPDDQFAVIAQSVNSPEETPEVLPKKKKKI